MCRENYNAFSGKAPVDYNTAAQMTSEGKLFIKLGGVDESTAGNPSTGSEIVIHNLTDSDWLFSGSYGSWPVCMGNVYVYLAENQNGKPLIGDGFDEQYFSLIPNYNVSSNEGIRNVKGYLFMACLIGKIALIGFCAKPNVNANFEKGDLYGHYSDVAPVGYADWANFETPFAQDVWNKYGSKVETGGQMVFELVQ